MSGVVKINISESVAELQELLRQQKTASGKERVQALYLLKTKQVESVKHLAVVVGRSRVTIQRWLREYRQQGINGLLQPKKSPGRTKVIPDTVREKLKQELSEPQGFKSYGEVQLWLKAIMGIEASYKVVHDTVRYQLKAKLKVPRPQSVKHSEKAKEGFKKNLSWELFDKLDELKVAVRQLLSELTDQVVASVTGWDFILEALSVSGIS